MIKICGIRELMIAEVAVEAGATAIGLVFSDSPRCVSIADAARICDALPDGIERIGVFRKDGLPHLPEILNRVNLTALQIHRAEELPETMHGREVIPGVRAEFIEDFPHRRLLVDSPFGEGSGVSWDVSTLLQYTGSRRIVVAGGLTPQNVAAVIEKSRPAGVDVSSGVESAPGKKDAGLVRAFVQAAQEAMKSAAKAGTTQ